MGMAEEPIIDTAVHGSEDEGYDPSVVKSDALCGHLRIIQSA